MRTWREKECDGLSRTTLPRHLPRIRTQHTLTRAEDKNSKISRDSYVIFAYFFFVWNKLKSTAAMRADIARELLWSLVRAPRNAKPAPESASMFLKFLTQMLGELVVRFIVIPIVLSRACVQSMWERRREEHAWIKRALDALDTPGVRTSKPTLASVSER